METKQEVHAHKDENNNIVVDKVVFQRQAVLPPEVVKRMRKQRNRTNRRLMEKEPETWAEYEAQVRARNGGK